MVTYVIPFFERLKWNIIFECSDDVHVCYESIHLCKQEVKAYMKTKHTNIQKSYVFADPMTIFSENGSLIPLEKIENEERNMKKKRKNIKMKRAETSKKYHARCFKIDSKERCSIILDTLFLIL